MTETPDTPDTRADTGEEVTPEQIHPGEQPVPDEGEDTQEYDVEAQDDTESEE